MAKTIEQIVPEIKSQLESKYPSVIGEFEKNLANSSESKVEFLLKTACEYNLLHTLHDLLELNLFENINQPLTLSQKNHNGLTLLGLAAFHGHKEIVSYLVEVRLADTNAQDTNGDTPLHQVVYGDSRSYGNSRSYGVSHDKVAKYLIKNNSDLSIENNNNQTPYDSAKCGAPLKIEAMFGRRFITKTDYADKVRPILEKELARQTRNNPFPVIKNKKPSEAITFKTFCLEHAIKTYVKENKAGFGYSDISELYQALDSLSKEEWANIGPFLSSQAPTPFSSKMGLICDELPKIAKQGAASAVATALFT